MLFIQIIPLVPQPRVPLLQLRVVDMIVFVGRISEPISYCRPQAGAVTAPLDAYDRVIRERWLVVGLEEYGAVGSRSAFHCAVGGLRTAVSTAAHVGRGFGVYVRGGEVNYGCERD